MIGIEGALLPTTLEIVMTPLPATTEIIVSSADLTVENEAALEEDAMIDIMINWHQVLMDV
jgi:hypothetical protein